MHWGGLAHCALDDYGNQVFQCTKQDENPHHNRGGLVALYGEPNDGVGDESHEHGLASPSRVGMPGSLL